MRKMFSKYGFDNSDQPGERDLGQGGFKFDGLTAESASNFIRDKKGNEKPWSVFVNFVNPHDIMFFRASLKYWVRDLSVKIKNLHQMIQYTKKNTILIFLKILVEGL